MNEIVKAIELAPGDVVEVEPGRPLTVVNTRQERSGSFVVEFENSALFGLPNRYYVRVRRATIPA